MFFNVYIIVVLLLIWTHITIFFLEKMYGNCPMSHTKLTLPETIMESISENFN